MAELADAADSKSAGLRPLGVQLPLPAPTTKAALDAVPKHLHLHRTARTRLPRNAACDRSVTRDVRTPAKYYVQWPPLFAGFFGIGTLPRLGLGLPKVNSWGANDPVPVGDSGAWFCALYPIS